MLKAMGRGFSKLRSQTKSVTDVESLPSETEKPIPHRTKSPPREPTCPQCLLELANGTNPDGTTFTGSADSSNAVSHALGSQAETVVNTESSSRISPSAPVGDNECADQTDETVERVSEGYRNPLPQYPSTRHNPADPARWVPPRSFLGKMKDWFFGLSLFQWTCFGAFLFSTIGVPLIVNAVVYGKTGKNLLSGLPFWPNQFPTGTPSPGYNMSGTVIMVNGTMNVVDVLNIYPTRMASVLSANMESLSQSTYLDLEHARNMLRYPITYLNDQSITNDLITSMGVIGLREPTKRAKADWKCYAPSDLFPPYKIVPTETTEWTTCGTTVTKTVITTFSPLLFPATSYACPPGLVIENRLAPPTLTAQDLDGGR
ncbi:hypothetical protein G7Y89_g6160 [Cudoniella acicularis]|uniref:Uncharacterized protein n=1 Tax=Cudoniella acicularis TaxID=354080 RepID=A0A8H4RL06_9HELO|nr:hypothetical protein G7Y89_g6160 [Cudoniella acicularis]